MMTRRGLCGQDKAMVQVMFDDSGASPTQDYALARWRDNPRLSPSSWRQALGNTLGKVAFDARCGVEGLVEAVALGCNLLVVPAGCLEEALAAMEGMREQVVIVGVGSPRALRAGVDWWLWDVGEAAPEPAGLMVLEQAVKDGVLDAYGISGEASLDLAAWLAAAGEVAGTVWGRRKRSGLRVVEVPLNGVEQEALRGPGGNAAASLLEHAARLGMVVLVSRSALWRGPWGEVDIGFEGAVPSAMAVAALVAVGEAEQAVPGLTGGVLPALAAGASPWPTRAAWAVFEEQVWPGLEQALLARGEEAYVAAWRGLLPHGASLAAAAEGRLATEIAGHLASSLPDAWRGAPPAAQAWGLASSVPGVTAVVADLRGEKAQKAMVAAMERPDVTDVKRALDGVIHRA